MVKFNHLRSLLVFKVSNYYCFKEDQTMKLNIKLTKERSERSLISRPSAFLADMINTRSLDLNDVINRINLYINFDKNLDNS